MIELQKSVDRFEGLKLILMKDGIDYKDFTLYEFFFHLNKALKPKKKVKK